ncbi:MAG: DUF4345 family protein [Anaerolineae bacterium]|nr:DUF4345 family protein [Anaerolineae bacterium]
MIITILQIVVAVATILTGLLALARPQSVKSFTGLSAESRRGATEIRTSLGGFFIGLGAAVLILNAPAAYRVLGITYLTAAVVRTVSMFVDSSVERSNLISIATEVVFGVILML